MMEICIRVKDKSPSYIISSIDFNRQTSANNNNRRRSLIGKIFSMNNNEHNYDSESTPIYSVSSDSPSATASLLSEQERALSSSVSLPSSNSTSTSYQNSNNNNHDQQAAISEQLSSASYTSQSNDRYLSENESPILNCCDQQTGSRLISSGYYSRSGHQWSTFKCEQKSD